jgi:hypothetical protein
MTKDELTTVEALKRIAEVVDAMREDCAEAVQAMILAKMPCSAEMMQLGMLMQSFMSFSVALRQWIKLCEENHATIIKMKTNGN